MKTEFYIGQKVMIGSKEDADRIGFVIIDSMSQCLSKEATIMEVNESDVRIDIDNKQWYWHKHILSPLPHQDGASAEDVARSILLSSIPKDCHWEGMDHLTNTPISYVIKAMHQFAQSEVEKAVVEKDREIAELSITITKMQEKYDENGYDCSPLIKLQRIESDIDCTLNAYLISTQKLQSELSAANERIKELIEEKQRMSFMIQNGLGYEDLLNDNH